MPDQKIAQDPSRRRLLLASAGLCGLSLGASTRLWAAPKFESNPFTLGVASGEPDAQGFVIWTRLAPRPLDDDGGMPPASVEVDWEVAQDERFARVAQRGTALAEPSGAHALHVEVAGLQPDRLYWYRFRAGAEHSTVGRARTLPAASADVERFRVAFASCQHYEDGYYAAYRHLASDPPDLMLHLGDYIYEMSIGRDALRKHVGPEPKTLAAYRRRHAQYRLDPDLQAAHAACPWFMTWDDHDVENDYAADHAQDFTAPDVFAVRRAAAYQAWYEHLPLRMRARPAAGRMQLHTQARIGRLATLAVLDARQYRDDQACGLPDKGGGRQLPDDCAQRLEAQRTLLGTAQEQWLGAQLRQPAAHWNAIAQSLLFTSVDQRPGPGRSWWSDGWDGYPAARERLLAQLAAVPNPVVLGGDIHSWWVSEVRNAAGRPVASEFVTTSLSSRGVPQDLFASMLPDNPQVKFFEARWRGYTRCTLTPRQWRTELVAVDDVKRADSPARVLRSFVVEAGRPGPLAA